ncbi:MAG TPA: glycosyl hydrolase [Verrucomicrobiales bacterium]|nr:glycosyl hydrolase [Verrucomicrobiales bacterium]
MASKEEWGPTVGISARGAGLIACREPAPVRVDVDPPTTTIRSHHMRQPNHTFQRRALQSFQILLLVTLLPARAADPILLQPKTGLPPLEQVEPEEALPNYVPGAKWGTQAAPIRTMQKPLSPADSALHLVMPPGFEARLFAAEPEITKPICMAWDARGRLWVAETVDYPNDMRQPGEGRDRIRICEDTDGDGRADRFTVFADKLSIPTSLVFANGGVIVAQAPDMLFLKDTDGDGKADQRTVLFTGWGTRDTHAGPSNLRYGFDNWIWGTVGYSGFEGVVGGKTHKFGMGIYRFKPDGSELEFVRSSNNNTWGLGVSEEGIIFGSTANGNASMYMPIPNRFYESVNGWAAPRLETIADDQSIRPITDKVRQVDWHGKYTAGAGHALYTARSFPRNYWNRSAFVCEPTGHVIGLFDLEERGADFVAHNRGSFLASDDEWTSPIAAEVGPDGALWMIDWYNYIVQHNPVPNGFKNGRGNAYDTRLRDKTHGRIYRVVHTGSKPSSMQKLEGAAADRLVDGLKSDNLLWRLHAQRLLVEGHRMEAVPALRSLVGSRTVEPGLDLNAPALHALWALHGLGALQAGDPVFKALKHPSAAVRRAAVSVLPRTDGALKIFLRDEMLSDPAPQVRLASLLALAEMPVSVDAGVVIEAMLASGGNAADPVLRDAAVAAGARHADGLLRSVVAKGAMQITPEHGSALALIAAHQVLGPRPDRSLALLASLRGASPSVAQPILQGLASHWPTAKTPSIDPHTAGELAGLFQQLDERSRVLLLTLAVRWNRTDLFASESRPVIQALQARTANRSASDPDRVQAAESLILLEDRPESARALLAQFDLQASPALTTGFIRALGESRHAETALELLNGWKQFTPTARRAGIALILRRPDWTLHLLGALEAGSIPKADLGQEHWQQLKSHPDKTIASRAQALQATSAPVSADREEVVRRLLPVARRHGDPARGREVFTSACSACHTFNGQGGRVGPELTGIGARDRGDILTDILDPNRSVESNFRMWTATTREGETFSGRLDGESQTAVEILDVTGQKHTLQRKELKALEASASSIMPVGFESIPEGDLASLLDYLTSAPQHP